MSVSSQDNHNHGTHGAAIIAAAASNNACAVGVAYHANISAIRTLPTNYWKETIDVREASALSLHRDRIHIYSNSWSPDNYWDFVFDGPKQHTKRALREGAELGRAGRGSIFVWAAGNGSGREGDSCSYDGYVNSIHTISVFSVTQDGRKPR